MLSNPGWLTASAAELPLIGRKFGEAVGGLGHVLPVSAFSVLLEQVLALFPRFCGSRWNCL